MAKDITKVGIVLDASEYFQCDECEGYFHRKTMLVFEAGRDLCKRCERIEAADVLVEAVTEFLDNEAPCPVGTEFPEESLSDEHDPDECGFCTLQDAVAEYERATGKTTA